MNGIGSYGICHRFYIGRVSKNSKKLNTVYHRIELSAISDA
jgi:hypothetical protein